MIGGQLADTAGEQITYLPFVVSMAAAPPGAVLASAATDTTSAAGTLTAGIAAPYAPILLDNPAHAGGSDQIYMGTGDNTGTGDDMWIAFAKLK